MHKKKTKYHSFIVSLKSLQMIQYFHATSRNLKILYNNNNNLQIITTKRHISIFPKIVSKRVRIPVCVCSGRAVIGSYITYKVEETTNYTMDRLAQFKKFSYFNNGYILIYDF